MSWSNEQNEKLKEFGSIIITVLLDAALVIIVGLIFYIVKTVLEKYIYHQPLEQVTDPTIYWIYRISKISILISFAIYAISDIARHLIQLLKSK